jgi:hypothetical protein
LMNFPLCINLLSLQKNTKEKGIKNRKILPPVIMSV